MLLHHQISILMISLISESLATPGVIMEATNDTVLKVKYTGGSANSVTHPAVSVEGRALGIKATANNTTSARGLVGLVSGHGTTPRTQTVGVAGGGYFGVYGNGTIGVQGEGPTGVLGYGWLGVKGISLSDTGAGVRGEGSLIGVSGQALGEWPADGIGVSGHAVSGYGVYGLVGDGYAGYFEGAVVATGGFYTSSDEVLKQNTHPIQKGLATILALEPKGYEMKNGVTRTKHKPRIKLGLLAHEVQTVLPEVVIDVKGPSENGNYVEYKAIEYTALIPVLIKAIQEQQARIEALEAKLKGQ